MITEQKRIIQESLQHLAATHANAVAEIERTMRVLASVVELDALTIYPPSQSETTLAPRKKAPVADRTTLSAVWRGRSCFLGNTLLFRLFERLARSPNQYVTYDDLLDDVWDGGMRESSSVRGVAKRLRDRLIAAEMKDLAQSINGCESGHYGLILV